MEPTDNMNPTDDAVVADEVVVDADAEMAEGSEVDAE